MNDSNTKASFTLCRWPLILLGLLIILFGLIRVFFLSNNKKPNIVLVIIDTLRADRLGCYGFNLDLSPEIDEIASRGILFENVLAQCSWTRPSIASMITSLYPRSTGIVKEGFDILHDRYVTLAEILKSHHYTTIGITANPSINSSFNFHQGFDIHIDSGIVWKWMKRMPGHKGFPVSNQLPRSDEVFETVIERITQIQTNGSEGPFYVQINVMDVHTPFDNLRQEYKGLFDHIPVERTNRFFPEDVQHKIISGTYGAIRQVSHDLGAFVKKIRSFAGWEDTLFIITSDHGQGLDDHPDVKHSVKHGSILYKSQIMVPLIFYHPGHGGNEVWEMEEKRISQPVRLLDLMPTLLDYTGLEIPQNVHGISFFPLLSQNSKYLEMPWYFVVETNWRKMDKLALYSDEWIYIEHRDGWGGEEGVNPVELQPRCIIENGMKTDVIGTNKIKARRMATFLKDWEKKFPRERRTQPKKKPSTDEVKKLESLGYLDE